MDTNQNTGFSSGVAGAPPQQDWKQGAEETKRGISQKTKETTAQLKEKSRETAQDLKRRGTEKAHELQERGTAFVDGRKSEFAHKISGCGAAVRRAADKLRDENDPNIAQYADLLADRFEQAGNYVETRDLGAMYRDLETAARRRPEILFGGMFIAGLAIARFLKASTTHNDFEVDDEQENYWVEDDYDTESLDTAPEYAATAPVGPVTPNPVTAPATGSGPNNPGWSPQ